MGGQGIQPGNVGSGSGTDYDYPSYYKLSWGAALNGLYPNSTQADAYSDFTTYYQPSMGAMVLTDKLVAAGSDVGGNPYTGVAAYDSDADLAAVQTSQDALQALVDAIDSGNMTTLMSIAVGLFDTNLATADIEDQIVAAEARSLADHLQNVGRVNVSLWAARSILGSQAFITAAAMEHDRQIRLDEESTKLRLFGDRERTEGILRLTDQLLRHQLAKIDAQKSALLGQFDTAKLTITSKQDRIEHDLDMEVREATWDLSLFEFYNASLGALCGATTLPRAQTKRERLAGAVLTSASFGVQTGLATGSPAGGVAGGLLALGTQLYGMG